MSRYIKVPVRVHNTDEIKLRLVNLDQMLTVGESRRFEGSAVATDLVGEWEIALSFKEVENLVTGPTATRPRLMRALERMTKFDDFKSLQEKVDFIYNQLSEELNG